jgi:glucokinase
VSVVGALDVGGSHVSAGRVDVDARAVDSNTRVRLPLSASGRSELLATIAGAARSIGAGELGSMAVAVPGPFDYAEGVFRMTHKLEALFGADLRAALADAVGNGTRLVFLNDAEAFVLGEWWAGAARGHARVVGVTLGTGLGAAFLSEGEIVRTGRGVPPRGALWELAFRGAPVEEAISARGLLAAYGSSAVDAAAVAERAKDGEQRARCAFAELGRALGEFLVPWLRAFEPTYLVVGGSIARSWDLLGSDLDEALASGGWDGTATVAAELDDAPLLGGAWHVLSETR